MRTLLSIALGALLMWGGAAHRLAAQVRPGYGGQRPQQPKAQTIQGRLKSIEPSGLLVDVEGMEVRIALSRLTEVVVSARVADPALVLRPGAFVRTAGNLEGPAGPVGTGGVTVVLGVPRDRKQLLPDLRVSRPQVPGDPPPVTLRGRIVATTPAVIVAAGRYRLPLRLPEKPDVNVNIYGPAALRLASPGDDVSATLRVMLRPGVFLAERVAIRRSAPLTAEDLSGPGLPGAKGKRTRAKPSKPKPKTEPKGQEKGKQEDQQKKAP